MNNNSFASLIICASFLLTSCGGQEKSSSIVKVKNPAGINRPDELVVFKRSAIEAKTGQVPEGKYVTVSGGKVPAVVQYDDLDGDGSWDELAFLYSFQPEEEAAFTLTVSDTPATIKAMVRAHARHRRKQTDDTFGADILKDSIPAGQPATDFSKQPLPSFLTEGPAWENDKVGFRIYFDVRNGKDIWGKTTSAMVLDNVGLDTAHNYHALSDWGMDILKVGPSLGAGSLALQIPLETGKDTLVRLGGMNMGKVIYEKIADGPVRSIIRLRYPEWKVLEGVEPVSLTEEISIWGGQYFYESKVKLENVPDNAKLATGIVNLKSKSSHELDTATCKILYTFDKQTENHDELGMALILPSAEFDSFFQAPNENSDIQHTYGVLMKIKNGSVVFRFYAGWGRTDSVMTTENSFSGFLKNEAAKVHARLSYDF